MIEQEQIFVKIRSCSIIDTLSTSTSLLCIIPYQTSSLNTSSISDQIKGYVLTAYSNIATYQDINNTSSNKLLN